MLQPVPINGRTCLQPAAGKGHLSMVKMLLAAGADVHTLGTKGGYSALSAAIEGNNLEMVRLFLKTASPNGHADREPPLLRASTLGRTEMVQRLIQAGANANALRSGRHAYTALEAALSRGDDIFYILWDAVTKINGQVPDLGAAPGWRRKPINMDIVHKFLIADADVNRVSYYDIPLHQAASIGRLDIVQILLDAGADVNGRTPDGDTALRNGVWSGNIDIIEVLLDSGAHINALALIDRGQTTLQEAIESGNTSIVRFLLEQSADCNAPGADSEGVISLQVAAIERHLSIALMLLKAGANINAPAAKKAVVEEHSRQLQYMAAWI